jgi:hypothetical protein
MGIFSWLRQSQKITHDDGGLEEARRQILSKIKIGGSLLRQPWTFHDVAVAIFGLFVILSTTFTTFEIFKEFGAPDVISAIGATAAFMGTLTLIDRPKSK